MATANANQELREQLETLAAHKWLIIVTTVLAIGISAGVTSLQDERYSSTARLLVETTDGSEAEISTEAQRVASIPVAQLVAAEVDATKDPATLLGDLSVNTVGESSVLAVTYSSTDPDTAARVANGFTNAYLTYTRTVSSQLAAAAASDLEALIADTEAELDAVVEELGSERPGSPGFSVLETRRFSVTAQLEALQQRSADARLAEAASLSEGEVLADARVPSSPSSPDWSRNLIFAGLAGLIAGMALAFLRG